MKYSLGTIGVLILAGIAGAFGFVYSGLFDIAANDPHWPVTYRIMETVRVRSIQAHAAGITPPPDLGSTTRIVAGTAHFANHCQSCHSAPGVAAEDMADGMYPKPPVLTDVAKRFTPGELFWILKNGIKMSGMPSWEDHGDDELWNAVAFLEAMPNLTEAEYSKLVAAAQAAGGPHMQGGAMPMDPGMTMGKPAPEMQEAPAADSQGHNHSHSHSH